MSKVYKNQNEHCVIPTSNVIQFTSSKDFFKQYPHSRHVIPTSLFYYKFHKAITQHIIVDFFTFIAIHAYRSINNWWF
jgi:hypothetical protein